MKCSLIRHPPAVPAKPAPPGRGGSGHCPQRDGLVLLSRKIELPTNRRALVNDGDSCPDCEATMDLLENNASRVRFEAYIEQLANVIGHADRMVPLHDYCTGLLLPGERKSVEPMAALTAPARTAAKNQSLLHFVAIAPWSDEAVLTKVRQMALPKIEALGAIEASIIDDTGF